MSPLITGLPPLPFSSPSPSPSPAPMALSQLPFLFSFPTVRNSRSFSATTPRSLELGCWPRMSCGLHDRGHTAAAAVLAEDLAIRAGEDLPEDYTSRLSAKDPSRRRRRAGVLLHPTSLPGPYGIGDLGDEALRFLDWLRSAGCFVWQV